MRRSAHLTVASRVHVNSPVESTAAVLSETYKKLTEVIPLGRDHKQTVLPRADFSVLLLADKKIIGLTLRVLKSTSNLQGPKGKPQEDIYTTVPDKMVFSY
jgi:hypothetical protein